jgi:Luciferase
MNALQTRVCSMLRRIDGVVEGDSVFTDGPGFWVNGKQMAHFLDDNVLQLRLTRSVIREHRDRLRADARVELRQAASDWVKIRVTKPSDVALVSELAGVAAAAHRAPKGATPVPPPTGSDLARRRRFH